MTQRTAPLARRGVTDGKARSMESVRFSASGRPAAERTFRKKSKTNQTATSGVMVSNPAMRLPCRLASQNRLGFLFSLPIVTIAPPATRHAPDGVDWPARKDYLRTGFPTLTYGHDPPPDHVRPALHQRHQAFGKPCWLDASGGRLYPLPACPR